MSTRLGHLAVGMAAMAGRVVLGGQVRLVATAGAMLAAAMLAMRDAVAEAAADAVEQPHK